MADTKISALTAAASAALANEFAINEAGVSKKVSGTQLATLFANPISNDGDSLGTTSLQWSDVFLAEGGVINWDNGDATITQSGNTVTIAGAGLICAAGTTANAGLTLTSGTLLTTPAAGALEYDGKVFYACPEASNRGVLGAKYFICLSGTNTLTSSVSEQPLFDSVGGGVLTLPTGTYFFEALVALSSMSGTSGNLAFDILGAGTATLGSVLYNVIGVDGAINTAATRTGCTSNAAQTPASLVTAGTNTNCSFYIRGTFRVTVAGTIIPSATLVTAAAAVVAVGSFFSCECIGSSTVQTVGQWS